MTESGVASVRAEILAYYGQGREPGRLLAGEGLLEFWQTRDVLRRLLPTAPARVLDVGGGSGVHAEWLAGDGYQVTLVDPVPTHVALAAELPGVTARLGDARALEQGDGSADAVLLLGPLYHLPEREDRLAALREAVRVVRPGGLVVAATINRFAGLHDTVRNGRHFEDAAMRAATARTVVDGVNPGEGPAVGFTTAYFHDPAEILDEFTEAGLSTDGQYGVEGAFWLMPGVPERLLDPEQREVLLDAARSTESVPSLLGVSGHLLTVGRAGPIRPQRAP